MANALVVLQVALEEWRRLYGVAVRPEDHEILWASHLDNVRDNLDEMIVEEGGEG